MRLQYEGAGGGPSNKHVDMGTTGIFFLCSDSIQHGNGCGLVKWVWLSLLVLMSQNFRQSSSKTRNALSELLQITSSVTAITVWSDRPWDP